MQDAIYHSNKYTAVAACPSCEGIVRHESWCISQNENVLYAWEIIANPAVMTEQDRLILHALGIVWTPMTPYKEIANEPR
jgi:hypothetical protein